MRSCILQKQAREDIHQWVKFDRKIALKVLDLMNEGLRDPYTGRGKPEPLKHLPGNIWSRRITQEDRLVYRVDSDKVDFLQAKYHYQPAHAWELSCPTLDSENLNPEQPYPNVRAIHPFREVRRNGPQLR